MPFNVLNIASATHEFIIKEVATKHYHFTMTHYKPAITCIHKLYPTHEILQLNTIPLQITKKPCKLALNKPLTNLIAKFKTCKTTKNNQPPQTPHNTIASKESTLLFHRPRKY